jgi:putative transposase
MPCTAVVLQKAGIGYHQSILSQDEALLMSGPQPNPIVVTDLQRAALQAIAQDQHEEHGLVTRAWIILLAHQGQGTRQIARYLHLSEDAVARWKQRWRDRVQTGLGETDVRTCLVDAPRCGGPCTITAEQWCQIMALACSDPKESGRPITHWTHRELADEAIKRQIVETISPGHVGQFLKRSRSQAPSQPLLAASGSGPAPAGAHQGRLPDL